MPKALVEVADIKIKDKLSKEAQDALPKLFKDLSKLTASKSKPVRDAVEAAVNGSSKLTTSGGGEPALYIDGTFTLEDKDLNDKKKTVSLTLSASLILATMPGKSMFGMGKGSATLPDVGERDRVADVVAELIGHVLKDKAIKELEKKAP